MALPDALPSNQISVFTITDTNRGGIILLTIILGIVLTIITVGLYLSVRLRLKGSTFSSADIFVIATSLSFTIQCITMIWDVTEGLGRTVNTLSPSQTAKIEKGLYAERIFFVLTLWLSKACAGSLLFRLSDQSASRLISGSYIFLVCFTAAISLALVTLTCNLSQPWIFFVQHSFTCTDMLSRLRGIAALDMITEVLLMISVTVILLSTKALAPNNMAILATFGLRILLIIAIILRLIFLSKLFKETDPTLHITKVLVCEQAQMTYSVIICCIPFMLDRFTRKLIPKPPEGQANAGDERQPTVDWKVNAKNGTGLAKLPHFASLFEGGTITVGSTREIRHVPVDVYELDNTAMVLGARAPRDPPRIVLSSPESVAEENMIRHPRRQSQIEGTVGDADNTKVTGNIRRYTIVHESSMGMERVPERRNSDHIAVAM